MTIVWNEQPWIKLRVGRELFRFESRMTWVNKAGSRYYQCGLSIHDTLAIDAVGRVCRYGVHYSRAEREQTYPIVVYAADPEWAPQ